MIKNIYVSMETHPEIYHLDLGLDIPGDMVTVDTENLTIFRLPLVHRSIIHKLRKEDPIWESIREEIH